MSNSEWSKKCAADKKAKKELDLKRRKEAPKGTIVNDSTGKPHLLRSAGRKQMEDIKIVRTLKT